MAQKAEKNSGDSLPNWIMWSHIEKLIIYIYDYIKRILFAETGFEYWLEMPSKFRKKENK
jgi:hypothetical protein